LDYLGLPGPIETSKNWPYTNKMAFAMQSLPQLSPETREVLEVIVRNNTIDGSSLMRQLGMARTGEVVKAIRELESLDLVEVGGPISIEELPFARFAVRPSAKEYLSRMLRYLK